MTIFNQQTLLEIHPIKTQQPNDPTCTKKVELKKEEETRKDTHCFVHSCHVGAS